MNAFACSLALSAGIAFTGAPAPTERVETVVQDDAALLYRSPAQVRRCGGVISRHTGLQLRAAGGALDYCLVIGSIMASIIVLFFMRSWRSTIIAAVADKRLR